jgi:hypothetical protein
MALDKSPKSLMERQAEVINKNVTTGQLQQMSRGQKKRLMNKVNNFASKQVLVNKIGKQEQTMKEEKVQKQREQEKARRNEQIHN